MIESEVEKLIQKEIQDVLALKLLTGEFAEGQTVEVDASDGGLTFAAVSAPEMAAEAEEKEKV